MHACGQLISVLTAIWWMNAASVCRAKCAQRDTFHAIQGPYIVTRHAPPVLFARFFPGLPLLLPSQLVRRPLVRASFAPVSSLFPIPSFHASASVCSTLSAACKRFFVAPRLGECEETPARRLRSNTPRGALDECLLLTLSRPDAHTDRTLALLHSDTHTRTPTKGRTGRAVAEVTQCDFLPSPTCERMHARARTRAARQHT